MDQIRQQVDLARRRLWLELFVSRLIKCWFAALCVAAGAIAVPKAVIIEQLPTQWDAICLIAALVAGVVAALAWTLVRSRTPLDAAIEIDRRFELKERVASSLSLSSDAADTPAGKALIADAVRAVARMEIGERFKVRLGRAPWLPLGPAALALLLMLLLDNKQAQSSVEVTSTVSAQAAQDAAKALRNKLRERREEAARRGLAEAEALLLELERQADRLAEKQGGDPKQTLAKLNDLARQLEERRERIGGSSELQRQLSAMKDMGKGPADKMLGAIKAGDWKMAQEELKKLQEQLKGGKLDEAARKQLAQQMRQLEQRIAESAAQRQQAMEDLKKKIEQQKAKGNLGEAGELQEKLDRMAGQQQQSQQMQQLAQQLAQAQQSMEAGNQQAAAQAMQQMMDDLEQMSQDASEGAMLDMAMAQLEDARDAMAGEGEGEGEGGEGQGKDGNGRGGDSYGAGRGYGARPEDPIDAGFRDSQVQQDAARGAAIITGEAEGPTIRGDVRETVKEEMASSGSEPADPLVIEQLPRTQRENAEDYFNRLRDGD
jgi:hypothetical protein